MSEEKNESVEQNEKITEGDEVENLQKEENEQQELGPDELMAQQFADSGYEAKDDQGLELPDYEGTKNQKIDMLLDIPLEITVEIGSTQMLIEDVLKLNPNSIIELERFIDEPIDLKVNGKIVAKGELYTVQNNFGIKITHIITPEDRLKILEKE